MSQCGSTEVDKRPITGPDLAGAFVIHDIAGQHLIKVEDEPPWRIGARRRLRRRLREQRGECGASVRRSPKGRMRRLDLQLEIRRGARQRHGLVKGAIWRIVQDSRVPRFSDLLRADRVWQLVKVSGDFEHRGQGALRQLREPIPQALQSREFGRPGAAARTRLHCSAARAPLGASALAIKLAPQATDRTACTTAAAASHAAPCAAAAAMGYCHQDMPKGRGVSVASEDGRDSPCMQASHVYAQMQKRPRCGDVVSS